MKAASRFSQDDEADLVANQHSTLRRPDRGLQYSSSNQWLYLKHSATTWSSAGRRTSRQKTSVSPARDFIDELVTWRPLDTNTGYRKGRAESRDSRTPDEVARFGPRIVRSRLPPRTLAPA